MQVTVAECSLAHGFLDSIATRGGRLLPAACGGRELSGFPAAKRRGLRHDAPEGFACELIGDPVTSNANVDIPQDVADSARLTPAELKIEIALSL